MNKLSYVPKRQDDSSKEAELNLILPLDTLNFPVYLRVQPLVGFKFMTLHRAVGNSCCCCTMPFSNSSFREIFLDFISFSFLIKEFFPPKHPFYIQNDDLTLELLSYGFLIEMLFSVQFSSYNSYIGSTTLMEIVTQIICQNDEPRHVS